jgi:hypothetical protein
MLCLGYQAMMHSPKRPRSACLVGVHCVGAYDDLSGTLCVGAYDDLSRTLCVGAYDDLSPKWDHIDCTIKGSLYWVTMERQQLTR